MKKQFIIILLFFATSLFAQPKMDPLLVLDSKKIGYMQDHKDLLKAIDPKEISTITVYKDSLVCQKYNSNSGVIVITTKRFLVETFFKNFIENTSLNEKIKSSESLASIGIVNGNPKSKNQPYDELYKYVDTNSISEPIQKIASIVFLDPEDSIKINPEWINGAIEITAALTE